MTCGCGNELDINKTYQVETQLQCEKCMLDAIDCTVPVLVRKIDAMEAFKDGHRTAS